MDAGTKCGGEPHGVRYMACDGQTVSLRFVDEGVIGDGRKPSVHLEKVIAGSALFGDRATGVCCVLDDGAWPNRRVAIDDGTGGVERRARELPRGNPLFPLQVDYT